jgi:hypothetical protein
VVVVTAGVVAPLIPTSRVDGSSMAAARPRRPLPLPHVPARPAGSLRWATATMDRDGRVSDAFLFGVLGWAPATHLDMRVDQGLILIRPDPNAVFRTRQPGQIRLPAAVRHRCGLAPGDRLLLVVRPDAGRLVVHPPDAVARMVAEFHAGVLGGDVR